MSISNILISKWIWILGKVMRITSNLVVIVWTILIDNQSFNKKIKDLFFYFLSKRSETLGINRYGYSRKKLWFSAWLKKSFSRSFDHAERENMLAMNMSIQTFFTYM